MREWCLTGENHMNIYRRDLVALTIVSMLALVSAAFAMLSIWTLSAFAAFETYPATAAAGLMFGAMLMGGGLYVIDDVVEMIDDLFKNY